MTDNETFGNGAAIESLVERMDAMLVPLVAAGDNRAHFLTTYRNTTAAVATELAQGGFEDAAWLERLDLTFATLYLDAFDAWQRGEPCSVPWRVAFDASKNPKTPALRHILLGMNAHINYDLPIALLATVTDAEFNDPMRIASRERDHNHINGVLLRRVAEEDDRLTTLNGGKSLVERAKQPLERLATGHFLKEARAKVWINAKQLASIRAQGDMTAYQRLVQQLSDRSTAKLRQLISAREVLLQLWFTGFGIVIKD